MKDRIIAWVSLNGPSLGIAALIVVMLIMLSGCGTVAGLGKDVTSAAEWTKDKMTGSKEATK
jgi:predicted small secreted protein